VPHTIRLQGPWQCETLAGGLVRYGRSFHCPTGLTPGHRVWLAIGDSPQLAQVQLNDLPLNGADDAGELRRLEITGRLLPRNVVSIDVLAPEGEHRRPQVALEIEEPA
jgi:hypothetical protein